MSLTGLLCILTLSDKAGCVFLQARLSDMALKRAQYNLIAHGYRHMCIQIFESGVNILAILVAQSG